MDSLWYNAKIEKLVSHYNECFDRFGNYVEKWNVFSNISYIWIDSRIFLSFADFSHFTFEMSLVHSFFDVIFINIQWALIMKQYRLQLHHLAIKQLITYQQNGFICTEYCTLEQHDIECCYIRTIYHRAIQHADRLPSINVIFAVSWSTWCNLAHFSRFKIFSKLFWAILQKLLPSFKFYWQIFHLI